MKDEGRAETGHQIELFLHLYCCPNNVCWTTIKKGENEAFPGLGCVKCQILGRGEDRASREKTGQNGKDRAGRVKAGRVETGWEG